MRLAEAASGPTGGFATTNSSEAARSAEGSAQDWAPHNGSTRAPQPVNIRVDIAAAHGAGPFNHDALIRSAQDAMNARSQAMLAEQDDRRQEFDRAHHLQQAERARIEGQFALVVNAAAQAAVSREQQAIGKILDDLRQEAVGIEARRLENVHRFQQATNRLAKLAADARLEDVQVETAMTHIVDHFNRGLLAITEETRQVLAPPTPANARPQGVDARWPQASTHDLSGADGGLEVTRAYLAATRQAAHGSAARERLLGDAADVLDAVAAGAWSATEIAELTEGAAAIVDDVYDTMHGRPRSPVAQSDAFIERILAGHTRVPASALAGNHRLLAPFGSPEWQAIQATWRLHDRVSETLRHTPEVAPAQAWLLETAGVLLDGADSEASVGEKDASELIATARAALDLALDFVPGLSLAKDAITLATGVNPVTGMAAGMDERVLIVAGLFAPAALRGSLGLALPRASLLLQRLSRRGRPSSPRAARFRATLREAEEQLARIVGVTLCPD